jgi:hypothetical protein
VIESGRGGRKHPVLLASPSPVGYCSNGLICFFRADLRAQFGATLNGRLISFPVLNEMHEMFSHFISCGGFPGLNISFDGDSFFTDSMGAGSILYEGDGFRALVSDSGAIEIERWPGLL